jgi:hypothetical protein
MERRLGRMFHGDDTAGSAGSGAEDQERFSPPNFDREPGPDARPGSAI